MVGPDHGIDPGGAELIRRRTVIGRRYDHDRTAIVPFAHERHDFVGARLFGMDQHGIGASLLIGMGAAQCLVQPPAGNQRLDTGDQHEIRIGLAVLAGFDLAAEFVHVGKWLAMTDKRIGLREQLVFDTCAGNTALAQFRHQATDVVEIAVTGIAVHQDRDAGRVGHEFENFENLGPGCFVRIAHAKRR